MESDQRSGVSAGPVGLRCAFPRASPRVNTRRTAHLACAAAGRRLALTHPANMEVLARIRTGTRNIEFALATTRRERAPVLAQRFPVDQRKGYYRHGLHVDRDDWERKALYFLATLPDGADSRFLLESARVILGESRPGFRFPAEEAFDFDVLAAVRKTAFSKRIEVGRVVAEAVHGIVIGGLLNPLGLIHAISGTRGCATRAPDSR